MKYKVVTRAGKKVMDLESPTIECAICDLTSYIDHKESMLEYKTQDNGAWNEMATNKIYEIWRAE